MICDRNNCATETWTRTRNIPQMNGSATRKDDEHVQRGDVIGGSTADDVDRRGVG